MSTFETEVADIRLHSQAKERSLWQLALRESPFQPGDTGSLRATARSGASIEIAVLAIEPDEEGTLWHNTEKPLLAGTTVTATITSPAK
jgi:alanyl-tRNA synthetase